MVKTQPTLQELRDRAYAASAAHDEQMRTDPAYRDFVRQKEKRADAAAIREGRIR